MLRGRSFDAVARLLVSHGSRRTALHLLSALGLGWTHVHPPATAAPRRRCQKLDKPCSRRKPCCKGTTCRRGRCACPRTKRPCRRSCIARTACCPATEESCRDTCVPKGACCTDQQQRCGNTCILRAACCTNDDCTGPCHTGTCGAGNQCALKEVDSPCETDVIGHCAADGACVAAACSDEMPCRESVDPCRYALCVSNRCTAKSHANGHQLPETPETIGDCHIQICDETSATGRSRVVDNSDAPPDPDVCTRSYCSFGIRRTEPYPINHVCDTDKGWVCDGQGGCGPPGGNG